MNISIINLIGWVGMLLIILGYLLISTKKISSSSFSYNLLNLLGGVGIIVNASYFSAWPSVVLNIFWVCIAIYAISKIGGKKK
jgi:formate hydrogenlyase subunit 3/multisubunit Na+/H+ antiporter MnhD subunit